MTTNHNTLRSGPKTSDKQVECPCCNGTGLIEPRKLVDVVERRNLVKRMRSIGMSYLQIMRAMGYKSPRSISVALGREKKKHN